MGDPVLTRLDELLLVSGPEGRARLGLRALEQRLAQAHPSPSLRVLAAPLLDVGPLPFTDICGLRRRIVESGAEQALAIQCERVEFTESGLVGQSNLWAFALERSGAVGVASALYSTPTTLAIGKEEVRTLGDLCLTLGTLRLEVPALQAAGWLVRLSVDQPPENARLAMQVNPFRTVPRSDFSSCALEDYWSINESPEELTGRLTERLAGIFGLGSAPSR